jgi:hypothetical protein
VPTSAPTAANISNPNGKQSTEQLKRHLPLITLIKESLISILNKNKFCAICGTCFCANCGSYFCAICGKTFPIPLGNYLLIKKYLLLITLIKESLILILNKNKIRAICGSYFCGLCGKPSSSPSAANNSATSASAATYNKKTNIRQALITLNTK